MTLSPLENEIMRIIWTEKACSADQVRKQLEKPLKESTVRTLLRRMEEKGFVQHTTEGRTYIYEPLISSQTAAARAVRSILDRFCQGSVEALLVGMVEEDVVDSEELRSLADRIERAERAGEDTHD